MLRRAGGIFFYSILLFGLIMLYPLNHIGWAIANRKTISVALSLPFVCLGLVIVLSYTNLLFGDVIGYIFLGMGAWGPFVGSVFMILRMASSMRFGPKQKYWIALLFPVLQISILFSLLALLARVLSGSAQLIDLSVAHGVVLSIIIVAWVALGTLILLRYQEDAVSVIVSRLAALKNPPKTTA